MPTHDEDGSSISSSDRESLEVFGVQRGVTISARRPLGAGGPLVWHTSLTRGLSWQTAGVREAVDEALAETRAEFDMR